MPATRISGLMVDPVYQSIGGPVDRCGCLRRDMGHDNGHGHGCTPVQREEQNRIEPQWVLSSE